MDVITRYSVRPGSSGRAGSLAVTAMSTLVPGVAHAAAPIASWSFDETGGQVVRDARGLADGTLGRLPGPDGADPTRVAGVSARALLFDGDDRVTLPDLPELEPATLSISAWVRRSGSPGTFRYVISKGGTQCFASAYGLYSGSGGGLAFYIADGLGYAVSPAAPPATVWDGRWHAVAGTFDGARVRLYVDGRELAGGAAAPLAVSYSRDSRAPFIGTYVGSCELPWSGEIDEVGLWNGPLSPSDAAALATPPVPGSPPTTPPANPTPPSGGPAAPGPVAGSQPPPRLPIACVTVTLTHRVAVVRSSLRVVIRVRAGGRPLQRTVVRLRGAGIHRSARTARDGRVRIRIRPTKRTAVAVTVVGRMTCDVARIPVRRR